MPQSLSVFAVSLQEHPELLAIQYPVRARMSSLFFRLALYLPYPCQDRENDQVRAQVREPRREQALVASAKLTQHDAVDERHAKPPPSVRKSFQKMHGAEEPSLHNDRQRA